MYILLLLLLLQQHVFPAIINRTAESEAVRMPVGEMAREMLE
jgi:hypothetical protein